MKRRLLAGLDNFFIIPPDANVPAEISRHFRHNFIVNGMDILIWTFGMSFVSLSAVLPVYVRHLTDSPMVFGLIPALNDAGWFLPQLFLAPLVERLARKLPTVAWLGAIERLPFLVLAVGVLWLDSLPRPVAVGLFILLMAWKGLASGIVATPWLEMIAKIIPISHRGRFFGMGNLGGQLLGIGGAALAAFLLGAWPYPQNFAVVFGIGFVAVAVSYAFTLMTREPALPPAPRPPQSTRQYTRRLWGILKTDVNFRTYLLSRWLMFCGGMATGFLAVYAVQRFNLSDATAGIFTAILFSAGVLGYAVWGMVGDAFGHKMVMVMASSLWVAALGTALVSSNAWGFYVVFALMGLSNAGGMISDLNIAMELGPESERPTYMGLTRTVTGPALLLAPLAGGWMAQVWGYPVTFMSSLVFAVAGLALLAWGVKEPRSMQRKT